MNIKNLFSKKNEIKSKENISEILGFEQQDCLHQPISYIDNIEKFIIKNNNVDTYISSYSQNDINAGIILGLPSNLDPYFKQSIELVNKFFNTTKIIFKEEKINSEDVLFLKPIIYKEINPTTGEKKFLLPSILTVATFDKFDEDNKTIRVAWWQNDYGFPEKNIIEQLEKIDWKKPYFYTWEV